MSMVDTMFTELLWLDGSDDSSAMGATRRGGFAQRSRILQRRSSIIGAQSTVWDCGRYDS